jgi:acetyl esterase
VTAKGLHPQVLALAQGALLREDEQGPPDIEAERAAYLRTTLELGGPAEEVAGVEDVVVPRADGGRVRARAYWPRVPAAPLGALVWLHGGGWFLGDVDTFDRVTRQLANASGSLCLSVDYRLAPEHPYPAAVHDARAAVAWACGDGAAQLGVDRELIVVGGDSAGGNLATVAIRHAREAVRAQVLVYPALDATMAGDSYREAGEDAMLRPGAMAFCWRTYLGAHGRVDDPDASPLAARDLAGMPPTYIAAAEHDVLRDDALRYARALEAAGVAVTLDRYDDMPHGFLRWAGAVDRARELIRAIGEFTRGAIARST